jgi:methylmalonyl-CoA/ethylmalonyl-CoA epimerase
MIKRITHVGIAVRNAGETAKLYEKLLGLKQDKEFQLPSLKLAFMPVGESSLELVEPLDSRGSAARFLEEKGEGIHHIAFEVEDISAEVERLKGLGIKLLNETPRKGPLGEMLVFIDPKATGGVLVELAQHSHD